LKDPGKNIRKAFYTLINGLGYTCVDEMTDNETLSTYVILSTQTENDNSTKTTFDSDCTILIDICSRQKNAVTKDTVDDMADAIVNAVKPSTTTKLTDSFTEFTLINVRRLSSNTLITNTSTGYLVHKLLKFSLRTTEI